VAPHRRARLPASNVTGDITARGRLKIFLGYAAGTGKTFQMLTEARDLGERGVDIVIGYVEPHGRKETMALAEGLETVPRRVMEYRGSRFEEMDNDAVLRRHPGIAVVDELAHTNVPGSPRAKRWEDVHVLLDAGIDVLTTMNVQHVESLNDQIWQSTGVRVRETIPDWVVTQADESSWRILRRAPCSTGWNVASCIRPIVRVPPFRSSSGSRRSSRFASWRCVRPRTRPRPGSGLKRRLPPDEG
jgi:K+-sensing histidine kinase KdpD